MASQLLLLIPTCLPAEFLQVAGNFRSVLLIILAAFFGTSRGQDMMTADHLTMVYVFVLSLFKASLISALVSLLCIVLPEHVIWKAYITFLLGIVAVFALKAVMTTRRHENVLPLDRVITQNTGGLRKLLYNKAFLLLLTSFLNTSEGQAMLAAEDHLTMVHAFVLSLLGTLFFLSILAPELPFTSSSLINKLFVVLLEALLASAVVSVLCIPLPDYLRWKAYTCFMLGVTAVLTHDTFIHQ